MDILVETKGLPVLDKKILLRIAHIDIPSVLIGFKTGRITLPSPCQSDVVESKGPAAGGIEKVIGV
jgi:hypothetical protein